MRKLSGILLFILFPILVSGQPDKGHLIDVTIRGLRDSDVYLAYHLGEKQYLKDTAKLDKSGHTVFSGKDALDQGIYMIVLPGRRYFEMLMTDDQIFSVSCDYEEFFKTLKFSGSDENKAFIEYQRTWIAMQQNAASLAKRVQNNKENTDSLNLLRQEQRSTDAKMKAYLKGVASDNKGKLLGVLVNAMLPVEIPEFKIPDNARNPDSIRYFLNYNYNKDHFFDNIDLADEKLLRTPVIYAKLQAFFNEVQAPDSINKEIDMLVRKTEKNYKVFQFIAVYLFNHFRESEIMGHDAIMVKLADDIYLNGKADWITAEFRESLRKQVELIRPNLIGKRAQNLVMNSYKGIYVSLDDVEKDFTILYFWEPDCGHCMEATPKLKAWYDKPREYTLEVFAVCTTGEKAKWTKYIEDNKLTWINGWDPERSSHFDYYYNVQSTPMVYILDRNKKIIAKKLAVDDIGSFIDNYRKYFR